MIRRTAIGLLFLLAACNRSGVADVTLDADAAQRNTTAAKTLADLDAAAAASQGPPPVVRDAEPVNVQEEAAERRDETRNASAARDEDASDVDQDSGAPANGSDGSDDPTG